MFTNVIVYSLLAGLSAIFGIFLVWRFENWTKKNAVFLISFAIGVLLTNAFFHLLPEAINLAFQNWFYWALGTIIFLYLIEHFIVIHSCVEEGCKVHNIGKMSFIGLSFHSLVDGLIIGAGFRVGLTLGALVSLAVIFHKISDGIFTYSLLIHDNVSKAKAWILSLAVALTTSLGAILTFIWAGEIKPEILGWLLAIAAGSFIYIGASDLIPESHDKWAHNHISRKHSFLNIILVLSGILFVFVTGKILG